MNPKRAHVPESKISIIFGTISNYQIHDVLGAENAHSKETKSVFLIRESATYPGLITVSYYSQEQEMVKHIRFGLTINGWQTAPKPPHAPQLTDTLDIKAKYHLEKTAFDEEMIRFHDTAKMLFEQTVSDKQIKSLVIELQKNEFTLEGIIKPSRALASQQKHFTNYVLDVFIDDTLSADPKYKQR